jgi:uncharacterized repeat protein (TIGR01451 family)
LRFNRKLITLRCDYNRLTSLNLELCDSLYSVLCQGNLLTNINVNNLKKLDGLNCSSNLLSSFNPIGLTNLYTLNIGGNLLTDFNQSGLLNLRSLTISNNLFYTVDISRLIKLDYFICDGNSNLSSIKMIGSGVDYFWDIYYDKISIRGNPNLIYICIGENILLRSKNKHEYPNVLFSNRCSSTIDDIYNVMFGNTKLDLDNNGCTSQDSNYPNLKFKLENSTDSVYVTSNVQGNFAIVLDSGTYTLTPQLPNNYFLSTPTSTTITLPEDTIPQQFCITPNGTHHDVSITVILVRAARPGFSDAKYKIVLKNKGNQIENGTFLFNYDENKQDFISASSTPNSITSGQLAFVFSNLQPFVTREITVTMRTNAPTDNPAVNTGDVIQLSVTANLDNGVRDEFFKDNFQNIRQTVVGSFDPNDKTCLEGDIITPTLVGDFVHYLIRFENTGTANAENIVVTDFIDLNTFDISTLEITSTSHNCKTLISNGNKVQFVFDNINLPFTEPLKHGYVAFKLKLKNNLGIGDSLKNKADIYFDYNLPITTNTAASRIDNVTAIKTNANKDGSLSIYPNPGNGNFIVNFESKGNNPILIRVSDLSGKIVYEQKTVHQNRSTTSIELQDLPNGMYQLQIFTDNDVWVQKLLIVK